LARLLLRVPVRRRPAWAGENCLTLSGGRRETETDRRPWRIRPRKTTNSPQAAAVQARRCAQAGPPAVAFLSGAVRSSAASPRIIYIAPTLATKWPAVLQNYHAL